MKFYKTITALLEMRKSRDINQSEIGSYIHLSRREISFIENGHRPLSFNAVLAYLNAIQYCKLENKLLSLEEKKNFLNSIFLDLTDIIDTTVSIPDELIKLFVFSKRSEPNPLIAGKFCLPKPYNNLPKLYQHELLRIINRLFETDENTQDVLLTIIDDKNLLDMVRAILSLSPARRQALQALIANK